MVKALTDVEIKRGTEDKNEIKLNIPEIHWAQYFRNKECMLIWHPKGKALSVTASHKRGPVGE